MPVRAGGLVKGKFFHCKFPEWLTNQDMAQINRLVLMALLLGLKLCGWSMARKRILLHSDNEVTELSIWGGPGMSSHRLAYRNYAISLQNLTVQSGLYT